MTSAKNLKLMALVASTNKQWSSCWPPDFSLDSRSLPDSERVEADDSLLTNRRDQTRVDQESNKLMVYEADSDHVASDDLESILELSREEHEMQMASKQTNGYHHMNGLTNKGASTSNTSAEADLGPTFARKQGLKEQIAQFDTEIQKYEDEIRAIRSSIELCRSERNKLVKELEGLNPHVGNNKGKGKAKGTIDYGGDEFEWSQGLVGRMKQVFGIESFRLCQQGVCNANMDGRDIVCIMPTGGGKSLTYQLPALLQPGLTVVISPLLSLITDQILHLQEAGVQAVKLTGGTSKSAADEIDRRLRAMANRSLRAGEQPIKLCYVTPEKIQKSKKFVSSIQRLAHSSQLARFVIDEAHCVSQLGHDFRPDYQKLHTLRQLFPSVPIMALSATCPPEVLEDLIRTLRLKAVVDGTSADTESTVYFSAPLYRKNLHYKVVPKPAKASDVLSAMSSYILQHHAQDSGIIYCLSKKDAESVAVGLRETSNQAIKTGVYHADVSDRDKEALHVSWRKGQVKVVCATIAFGLGIDKGDVRFVLHHSLSKSLEGYYQESGRAGRDGKDSDCVLYYRPQDASTISSMVAGEKEGREKLHAMLAFSQNLQECRKTQFAKYFSHSSDLSMSSWSTEDSNALTKCGHCDNCTRAADQLLHKEATLEAWQLLKITQKLVDDGANVTIRSLAALARGIGGGAYEVGSGGRGRKKTKEKATLDLAGVCGGPVNLSQDDIERLLIELLIGNYLKEDYRSTAYAINVYLSLGPLARRLTTLTREALIATKDRVNFKIECSFPNTSKARKNAAGKPKSTTAAKKATSSKAPAAAGLKRKRSNAGGVEFDTDDDDADQFVDDSYEVNNSEEDDVDPIEDPGSPPARHKATQPSKKSQIPTTRAPQQVSRQESTEEEDSDGEDWSYAQRSTKRTKIGSQAKIAQSYTRTIIREGDRDVMVLSD